MHKKTLIFAILTQFLRFKKNDGWWSNFDIGFVFCESKYMGKCVLRLWV